MATYNGRRFIEEQVGSILRALADTDELVIVDDGSSDGTWDYLQHLDDPRVRLYRNPSNRGVFATFERALTLTRHAIVFLADQDDVWDQRKRDAMVSAFLTHPSGVIVISDASVIDERGNVVLDSFMATRGGFAAGFGRTLVRNRYLGCAMALRRSVVEAGLPIPRRVPMHDMWFGAIGSLMGEVVYLPEPLLRYRRHSGNVSPAHRQSLWKMLQWRIALLASVAARVWKLRRDPPDRREADEFHDNQGTGN
jgi:glycosyltransferase involved in cell wall biosynthesis